MKIHAIVKCLNEEGFIFNQLKTIYPFCHRISVLSQFDRDWFGKRVVPDSTLVQVLNFPDPEGKIHLVMRKFNDETSAVNMEMLSFNSQSYRGIIPHGSSLSDIADLHDPPDYFWYVDADEIYDVNTIEPIFNYLKRHRPRGLRITGYNYVRTWNQRVPRTEVDFTHFGFIKAGILLEKHRVITWNEFRLQKLLRLLHLPDVSGRVFGFMTCPEDVGVFHHGCWLGDNDRIRKKFNKSSHIHSHSMAEGHVDTLRYVVIPTADLPVNIREASWPEGWISA